MNIELTRFAVQGLHGKFDIDIPIYDNKLILVGVNGLGKTTVVNLIYFLLTAQWDRLLETDFLSISVQLNGREIDLGREDVQNKNDLSLRYQKVFARSALRSPFPPKMVQKVLSHPSAKAVLDLPQPVREKAVRSIGRELGMPASYVQRIFSDLPRSLIDDLFESVKDSDAIGDFLSTMKEVGSPQVIYLPTYRRIEQDLKSIFPNLEEEDLRKLTARGESPWNARDRGHVELVQFGMQDVEAKIDGELAEIRERTRTQLSNLTASYLKDIISYRADAVEISLLQQFEDVVVAAVLERVEENTLSAGDKREVQSAIARLRAGDSSKGARDKYLAYFFSRILEIYLALAGSEKNILSLVKTCNHYFERKQLVYNDTAFTVEVLESDGSPLPWRTLSSGEKQVASLFTHLLLTGDMQKIVIVDEPELSLSVQWQTRLLTDIADSGTCGLLIAVTHSPFIYSNSLDRYAVDLSRCITFQPRLTQQ